MYPSGTRRHIQAALKLDVTMEEIMEVFKVCVARGIVASNLGIPILAAELESFKHRRTQLSLLHCRGDEPPWS